jgi:hypothetical protein
VDELQEWGAYFGILAQEEAWRRKGYDIDRAYRVFDEAEAELRDGEAAVDAAMGPREAKRDAPSAPRDEWVE